MDLEESRKIIEPIYQLLDRRKLSALLPAYQAARAALPDAEGPLLLALHEAIIYALDGLLSELGEHCMQNQALFGFKPVPEDIQDWVDTCAASLQEVRRLRDDSFIDSEPLIGVYVNSWTYPIGSRAWLDGMRRILKDRQDPEWVRRITEIVRTGETGIA